MNTNFWKGKRVFLTGHTGFKGSWLSLWLQEMGADVKGYALEPPTDPALFNVAEVAQGMESEIGDIRNLHQIKESMIAFNPEILIHMAAQPLVRYSYDNPLETYEINVMGTANVLEAARYCTNLRSVVSVTTDKCYENKEWVWSYREDEPMGGFDPYSSSKGCAELVTSAYRRSFFRDPKSASIASARAGNVIGGGDWAEDRLIPDILKAFGKNETVIIRNPKATRPWQHVLEPLGGYLRLAQTLFEKGKEFEGGWNFGPKEEDAQSVDWILDRMIANWPGEASWRLDENANPHEAKFLKLDCSKAGFYLNWKPKWNLDYTIRKIVEWQNAYDTNSDMRTYTLNEIKEYSEK